MPYARWCANACLLKKAHVPTLLNIELGRVLELAGGRAASALGRLCRGEGQPVPTSHAAVTDIDVEPS